MSIDVVERFVVHCKFLTIIYKGFKSVSFVISCHDISLFNISQIFIVKEQNT